MQLKRLEISGFKSFADKCAIDFPPGISSIVGPNGCGKSNIIDAIKWAMGEQSVKQLRGKSMGDVIFAGTDKRPPLNMAEVSLVIAGHDGTGAEFLDHYTEIMITRRLYRSGESQYLINRQPCRLKDVSDIFLRYSMGSRSCAIIQQGNIGAITDASPEERRAFIEEAAGVVRYKTRRQEALSKVSATRENLLRLNDILEEIESRLDELSVEAEKARRFKNCRSNLKTHDILVTVYYHEQYTRKIDSTEKLLNQLNEKTAYKNEEIERLHAALREIASYRKEKSDAIAQKKAAKEEKQRTAEKLEYEHRHLKSEEARIAQDNERFEASLEELEGKNKQTEMELKEEQRKLVDLQNRTGLAEKEIEQQSQAVAEHKEQLAEQSRVLDEKKERLMMLSSQHARHQNIFQNASANKENLERRIDRINEEIVDTKQEISRLSDSADKTRRHLEETKMHLDALLRRKSECERTLKEKNAALSEKIRTVSQRENERTRYKSRWTVLKKMESNFEWYKDGVRAIMKNRGKIDEQGRIMGIAAEVVDPAEGFEHAVEAAMGESLQYFIVNGQDAGIDYIDFLKREKAGRSGFIPIDISETTGDSDSKTNGGQPVAQMLSEHVNIRPGFESIIATMLAGVAVVEDINAAISLWQTGNGFRKIVTRQGDVVSGKGILVGGSRDQLAGILEKRQEIKQLQQDINVIDDAIAVEKKRQKEMEDSVKTLENNLSDITQKKFKYEADLLDAEKALYKTSEKLKHARRQMEISTLEKEKLSGEKADIDSEIEHHDQVLQDIAHDIETERSEIEEITGRIEALKNTIRTFNNRLVDLKLDATRLSAESDNTRRTVSRLKTLSSEGMERFEEIQNNIESGKIRKKEIREKMEACQAALSETLAALKEMKQDLAADENDYQSITDNQEHTDHRIEDAKTELEKTREKIHRLELELSGLQLNRENVVNRYLERYPEPFSTILPQYREMVAAPDFSIEKTEKNRVEIRTEMEAIGDVNLGAIEAYDKQKSRHDFLVEQRKDLEDALNDLERVIKKINRITRRLFLRTFEAVNAQFMALFPKLFNGGAAWLELTRPDLPLETGVELMIQPPGKKLSRLSLLSGGEKALSAIAFIFSIFMLNPASFCLLDEIDAPLDDVNVYRFNELLRIIGEQTQIIMISHKKQTMAFSDMLFGITVAKSGGSRMISVNIEQALEINNQQPAQRTDNEMKATARESQ